MSSDPNGPAELDELAALRAIVKGTAQSTGDEFFRSFIQHLAHALDVRYALLTEFISFERTRTLAFWTGEKLGENFEYDLAGTPCEKVVAGQLCHFASNVQELFPSDTSLREMGLQSYLGVPLVATDGSHLGHLCVFDIKPLLYSTQKEMILQIFAMRATAELSRIKLEDSLRASEQNYRDLFDEAPIAYVHEDLDSRFISANRAALRTLGLKPEEAPGFLGVSLAPQTPDAQRRIKEAFDSIGRGTDTSGVVLELRRKDNGKPVWIQWWSKPAPVGKYTRTMFIDITDRILLEQAQARLQAENSYLQEEIKAVHNFEEIIGQSGSLRDALHKVEKVAGTDTTVLITGETGTGKELIARAIHSNSRRRDKPLIKLNCAALPAGLVESELFGHERGAFSGAISRRVGRFELAAGGTIFLDEIGEVPLEVQAKLLRVLQEREFERLGGTQTIKADVRVIAATNRDLAQAVADAQFRADLFYRLNVFPVQLPPLRNRPEDIPALAQFFIGRYASRVGRRITNIEPMTLDRLTNYYWPGNVRELENLVERAMILSSGTELEIGDEHFPLPPRPTPAISAIIQSAPANSVTDIHELQREHLLTVLAATNWVIEGENGAAKKLGLHPNTLRSRLKKFDIKRPNEL